MASHHRTWRHFLIGLCVGSLFIALILREYSPEELVAASQQTDPVWILYAIAAYLSAMAIRLVRWYVLLEGRSKGLPIQNVGETLVIGYAANNLLPARLGELLRADLGKRLFGLSRSTVLGSIMLERLFDGLTIVLILIVGLVMVGAGTLDPGNTGAAVFWKIAALGSLIFVGALLAFWWSNPIRRYLNPQKPLQRRLDDLLGALAVLRSRAAAYAFLLSFLVWFSEAVALGFILHSLGLTLGIGAVLMLTGIVTLSTLIPTAPGYLGTLQYALHLGLRGLGESGAVGVIAATLMQIFLYGSLIVLAGMVWTRRWIRTTTDLVHSADETPMVLQAEIHSSQAPMRDDRLSLQARANDPSVSTTRP